MSVFECQINPENIHKLKQEKFKDSQVLFTNSKKFKALNFCFQIQGHFTRTLVDLKIPFAVLSEYNGVSCRNGWKSPGNSKFSSSSGKGSAL
jgi:hypothetical protein